MTIPRQIITPSDQVVVPPHVHDAIDISGTYNFIRALNVIIQGDIKSDNWDGLSQVPGSGATVGFFLDGSSGNAEFVDFFANAAGIDALTLVAQDGVNEGGQVAYEGAGSHSTALVNDRFQDLWRVIVNATASLQVGETRVFTVVPVQLPDGTAADPSLTFTASGQQDVGFFRPSDDVIAVTIAGSEVARFTGTAGNNLQGLAWTTYSPTTANLTEGSGATVARYVQVGDTVHVRWSFTLAADSSVGTSVEVDLPVAASSDYLDFHNFGSSFCRDVGGNIYPGVVRFNGTTRDAVQLVSLNSGGTHAIDNLITATSPFTWTTGDYMAFDLTYEAA